MNPKKPSPRCVTCQTLWERYSQACDKHSNTKDPAQKKLAEQEVSEAARAYLAHRRTAHSRHI